MTRSLPFALLAGASLLSGTAAFAVTPQAKPAAPQAKPAAPKPVAAAHRTAAVLLTSTTRTTTTAPGAKARLVAAKLANGKTVTYNCALAGNAAKQACK